MKRTKNMYVANSVESRELILFAENTYQVYKRIQEVIKNLEKKVKKGIYDPDKAVDLWFYVMTEASNLYYKEFGYRFTVTERFTAAAEMENNYHEEIGLV